MKQSPRIDMLHKRNDGGLANYKLHHINNLHERKKIRRKQIEERRILDQDKNK